MYNLHVTGKTPFSFLYCCKQSYKIHTALKLDPSYCVLLPPTGNTVCHVIPFLEDHSPTLFLFSLVHF